MLKLLLASICMLMMQSSLGAQTLDAQFEDAAFRFDLALAETLLPEFEARATASQSEADILAYARAALLVAELKRGEYESLQQDKKARRQAGKAIDVIAKSAIKSLAPVSELSERYRLEADLTTTMIRSNFRGMKLQPKVEEALNRALELDEQNTDAWVSQARRPLFALPKHGGDPAQAREYLDRALAVDPNHVQALLLSGVAWHQLGEEARAQADWNRAAMINPNTENAQSRLLQLKLPATDTPKE